VEVATHVLLESGVGEESRVEEPGEAGLVDQAVVEALFGMGGAEVDELTRRLTLGLEHVEILLELRPGAFPHVLSSSVLRDLNVVADHDVCTTPRSVTVKAVRAQRSGLLGNTPRDVEGVDLLTLPSGA